MTTENKIGWGNPEYDVRMAFSKWYWRDLYGQEMAKSKVSKEKNEYLIELVQDHTLLYNPRVPEHKDAQLYMPHAYYILLLFENLCCNPKECCNLN